MHWVDRGPEPAGLRTIHLQFSQGWVDHYQHGIGNRPSDTRWRDFHNVLSLTFSLLCAYCEEITEGEVDHFKPISKFPNLVYEWSNWIFACHYCNLSKSNKWPLSGYVSPCEGDISERSENFFAFNMETEQLEPKANISENKREKANQMIRDLKLNAPHHLRKRIDRLYLIRLNLDNLTQDSEEEQEYMDRIVNRNSELSSITRVLLAELGFTIDD